MDVAACHGKDTDRWFSHVPAVREEAKEVCNTKCSKRLECLAYILAREPKGYRREGIYGGMEPVDRETLHQRIQAMKEQEQKEMAS